jgi:hypothetical protein
MKWTMIVIFSWLMVCGAVLDFMKTVSRADWGGVVGDVAMALLFAYVAQAASAKKAKAQTAKAGG